MSRPIQTLIHMQSMRENLRTVRKFAGGRFVWAVVKANAYGHGLLNAMAAFEEADGLAIVDIEDIFTLRECGWTKDILLLEGFFEPSDIAVLDHYDVQSIVHNEALVSMLENARIKNRLRVYVKVNSGMNRLGFSPEEAPAVARRLSKIANIEVMGYVTHFANAEPDGDSKVTTVARQLRNMAPEMADGLPLCLANSAATMMRPEVGGAAVRPGIILYGISPDASISSESLGLEPAMTLRARIIALQNVAKGDAVGYGSRFVAQRQSRIAVVACGYADGYPRVMPDTARVWVENAYAPLAGNVSMDMMMIDVTDVPQATLGSWVELWGKHIPVNNLAKLAGTIGYELVCSLARRVPVVRDSH